MMQMVQEMMGVQQAQLMRLQGELWSWVDLLVAWETTVNKRLVYLWSRLEVMDMDEEAEEEEDEEELTMLTEMDKGSPVVLDSDLDNFRSLEVQPTVVRRGDMGGQPNWLVQIEEEPLDEVEELVLSGAPPSYDSCVVHRLVPIEDLPPYKDSPPYEDSPRYYGIDPNNDKHRE